MDRMQEYERVVASKDEKIQEMELERFPEGQEKTEGGDLLLLEVKSSRTITSTRCTCRRRRSGLLLGSIFAASLRLLRMQIFF